MISSRFNRIIIIFALINFAFTNIAQATFSISLPQIMASGCPANPTATNSSHLRSFLSPNSSTTTWTSASSTYTQILPGCCFRSNGIPGSCETQLTCKPQTGTPVASTTVPTPSSTVSATPNHSPSPSHSSGRRSMELEASLLRSLALLGLISMAFSYLGF
ncbi:hypothetical protein EAF00_004531 [Botryotinia globosa]|nr:hypothetical protein EAF00_004531 [Botryotinia globosa]